MKKQIMTLVVIAIAAGVALGGSAVFSTGFFATSTSGCNIPYPPPSIPSNSTINQIPVFFLNQGQTGRICVQYQGIFVPEDINILDTTVFAVPDNNNLNQPITSSTTAKYAEVNSDAKVVNDPYSTTIVYDFTASSNSKGMYSILSHSFCPGLPLAVGYNNSTTAQLPKDKLARFEGPNYGCSGASGEPKIVGLSGMDVKEFP